MVHLSDSADFIQPTLSGPAAKLVTSLSRAIHEHRLAPGTKLGEDELSEIYGVSRTVVRAALQALSHVDLVELRRNRGAFVARPTPQEAREVFEARALLEPPMARRAAGRVTSDDMDRLCAHIDAEHQALADQEPGRALRLSGQFHIEIAHIAGQSTVAGFIERLVARSSLIIALYWSRESALCEESAHHALVEALRGGQEAETEVLMRTHLRQIETALDLSAVPDHSARLGDILTRDG